MSDTCTLITGASSGIGRQVAIQLSKDNNIIVCGRNREALKGTLDFCSTGNKRFEWVFDLQNVEDLRNSLESFLSDNQLVVNNFIHCAGMMKVMHARNIDLKSSVQIFNVNFFSALEIITLLLKKKLNGDNLRNIVLISAIIGEFGARGHQLYAATKSALDGLMRSLAVELAPAVRVNTVLPGSVKTPMSEAALNNPDILEKTLKETPLGIGTTEDIANVVEFLVSDKAKWITGQQFVVDGGRTINISHK